MGNRYNLAELAGEELQAQAGEGLPYREAMSPSNADIADSVNAAVAANVLSDDSSAIADAAQAAAIDQGHSDV